MLKDIHRAITKPEMVNEDEAARMLSISKRTLIGYVASGRVPVEWYTTNDIGQRMYKKDYLHGHLKAKK